MLMHMTGLPDFRTSGLPKNLPDFQNNNAYAYDWTSGLQNFWTSKESSGLPI